MREFVVEGLSVAKAERPLIDGLSFRLRPGSAVALRGRSGIGKTSVLRALATIDPCVGRIELDGMGPSAIGYPAWRRRVLWQSQSPRFFGGSVRDELARPFSYRSAGKTFDEHEASRLLDAFELGDRLEDPVRDLSLGEQQKGALIRSLLIGPEVLLLDEPTSALDRDSTRRVENVLKERMGAGLALVLVTHDDEQRGHLSNSELDLSTFRTSDVKS